jgi:predicted nucleic acid-binding protein
LIPEFLDLTEESELLKVVSSTSALFTESKSFLRKHLDHEFSFVDCTSFVVMREHGLDDALTADRHFTRAGFNALLR